MPNSFLAGVFLTLHLLSSPASSQFVAPAHSQDILRSPSDSEVIIRYKQPSPEICRTQNPNQKQYAGHIYLPPSTLAPIQQDYPINTFFWFFEARENPENAPLTIWLNGGPGSSSLIGMMSENGPCEAVPFGNDSIGTKAREHSWDAASNMLYIDQPNQVGYSYDVPSNGSLALLDANGHIQRKPAPPWKDQTPVDDIYVMDESLQTFQQAVRSTLLMNGTFPSGNEKSTANTTQIAASAAWHFLQAWLTNFPQYNPQSKGVNLFAESYGGKYGPTFFDHFKKQNQRRASGEISKEKTVEISIESLGIVNGCIDGAIQAPSYPAYANQNPYGIKILTDQQEKDATANFYRAGGCLDQIKQCRQLQRKLDPKDYGNNEIVNIACQAATLYCDINTRDSYRKGGADRSYYDISAPSTDAFPPKFYLEYLNNATVQAAVGAVTNFTESDSAVYDAFRHTGDFSRAGQVEAIADLLDAGVRVALIYGDRDYICNYIGGQEVSLAIKYSSTDAFRSAGYANIQVPRGTVGGLVRQHGNFSFSRVYNAGHLVPAYQPLTALTIFERVIRGKAISDGSDIDYDTYSTTGLETANTVTLTAPPPPEPTCYLRDIRTCSIDQWLAIGNKIGTIINGVWHNSTNTFTVGNDPDAGPKPEKRTWTWGTGPSWLRRKTGKNLAEWKIQNNKPLAIRTPSGKHEQDGNKFEADKPKEGAAALVGINGQGASIAALLVAVVFLVEMV